MQVESIFQRLQVMATWQRGRMYFFLGFVLVYQINDAYSRNSVFCSVQIGLAESASLRNSSNNVSVTDQCLIPSLDQNVCDSSYSRTRLNCQCHPACQQITLCLKNCSLQQTDVIESTCIEPSNITVVQATIKLLQDGFGWNRALVLIDSSCPMETCVAIANTKGISLINMTSVTDWITKTRIYRTFVVFYVEKITTIEVLCEAYRQERVYSAGYAWVIVGVDVDELLNTSTDMLLSVNCTLDMIKTVLNYTLVVESAMTENCGLQKVLREADNNIKGTNCLRSSEITNNSTVTIEITMEDICDYENRTAIVVFQYRQLQDNDFDKRIVAVIDKSCAANNYFVVFTICENETTIFPDGVPLDVSRVRVQDATHIATLIVSVILYGFLLTFAIGCLLFNILLRNRRIVKLTSPPLNCVMIAGAILLGSAIMLYTVPFHSTDILPPLCISRFGALVFGHDICFGIIVAKLIRIHHIFRNPSAKKRPIKDWHLLLGLGVVLCIEAVVFISLQAVAFTVTIEFGKEVNRENPMTINEMGVVEDHYIIICGNPPPDYAIVAFTVVIKLALHATAIVLAIRTRKIEVEAVNYAKETQALAYISTVYLVLLVVFNFTLEGYANVYGFAVGACAYLGSFTFLGLTFIPKMVALCKDPLGKNLFKTENATQITTTTFVPTGGISL